MSLEWIETQRPRMVELLETWAAINSGSHNVAGLRRQAAAIGAVLRELGGEVSEVALPAQRMVGERGEALSHALGRVIVVRSPRRAGPRVLLGIHYDTVYGEEHPFQKPVRLEEETIRGPGVCDAKGGLLVMLFALLAVERMPVGRQLNWEVVLNPDEELGSPGSAPLWEEAAKRNDIGLLFEPALADGSLAGSRKGSGNFTFVVHGRSAHAGRNSAQGRNAIHALAGLVNEVAGLKEAVPGIVVNTGFIHGGGPVNVVPDRAMGRVNFRVESVEQQREIEEALARIVQRTEADGIHVETDGGFHAPPKLLTPPIEEMLRHLQACGKALGIPIAWKPTGGTCDGNRLAAAGLPTVDSLGVRGGEIHTDQEFMKIESLTERARLVALFLSRLAAGEIQVRKATAEETRP
ncbi:MAG TPA: hydrolase [Phycisphaerae bacterium]|nr:hydrolase [Phycisphaerae bacterium]